MKALIVDDAKVVRVALGRIMNQLGFETQKAEDGKVALALMQAHPDTDVVMLDWNMPVMNGYDFLLALRADPRWHTAPKVVMVTTETGMTSMFKALAAGADEYIMKPFDKEMVAGKLAMLGIDVSDDDA
ncbi:MAG: response regulator [Mariprofundus sp.]